MNDQSRYIRVFEHEAIYTYAKEGGKFLTTHQFDQLCAYNDQHGNKYFTVLRKGVKFKHFVGVIQIGRITIEILPKTDSGDTKFWHKILLQMLAECKKVKRESVLQASLRKRENSLLDFYIEMYLDEVESLVHKGLTKKYQSERNQTKALKGKLLFVTHIRKNLVHKERFFTEHSLYSSDNIYNQIVKRGLEVISKLYCSTLLKDRATGLGIYFHLISDSVKINEKVFDSLAFSRNTEKYKEVISIARLIILNYSPDIKSGSENLLAILFNMNDLWEEFIYRQLLKTKEENTEVLPQRREKFWENKEIKPDIVVKRGEDTFIIDTKWKVLDQASPSDDDLKQIYTYNLYWKSYHSILIYPKIQSSPTNSYGKYHKGLDKEHGCTLSFLDLLDENRNLNRTCSEDIWNLISTNV